MSEKSPETIISKIQNIIQLNKKMDRSLIQLEEFKKQNKSYEKLKAIIPQGNQPNADSVKNNLEYYRKFYAFIEKHL